MVRVCILISSITIQYVVTLTHSKDGACLPAANKAKVTTNLNILIGGFFVLLFAPMRFKLLSRGNLRFNQNNLTQNPVPGTHSMLLDHVTQLNIIMVLRNLIKIRILKNNKDIMK